MISSPAPPWKETVYVTRKTKMQENNKNQANRSDVKSHHVGARGVLEEWPPFWVLKHQPISLHFNFATMPWGPKKRGRRQAGLWLAGAPGGTTPGWPQGEDQVSGAVAGVAGTRPDICLADVSYALCIWSNPAIELSQSISQPGWTSVLAYSSRQSYI